MFYLCYMPMLEEAIVNLLLRHNCVVVPAFGGFVAQSSGAIIDMNTGIITPPRKSVLFNKQLINNDGLLIAHLSKESEMDYSSAENFLQSKVNEWHDQLKEGKRVSIDKIGHLFLDAERNISFEQDRYFNLLLESYGLNKVHFISEEDAKIKVPVVADEVPVEETKIIPVVAPVLESETEEKEKTKIVAIAPVAENRKMWKYIAAAVLLPFAFFTYWIPVETNVLESGMISVKDFNPMYQAGEGVYQQNDLNFPTEAYEKEESAEEMMAKVPVGTDVFYYKFDKDLMIPVRVNSEQNAKEVIQEEFVQKEKPKIVEEKPLPKKAAVQPSAPKMHYITGCFSDRSNAEAMVKKMRERGLNGQILDEKNGMTRVSAGGTSSQAEFNKLVKKAQKIGYKGWKLD